MEKVTVSSDYAIIIPESARKKLGIKIGQKIQIIQYDNRLEMIPIRETSEMRGFLKGIDTAVSRERDRI